jgi:hypothetical protein
MASTVGASERSIGRGPCRLAVHVPGATRARARPGRDKPAALRPVRPPLIIDWTRPCTDVRRHRRRYARSRRGAVPTACSPVLHQGGLHVRLSVSTDLNVSHTRANQPLPPRPARRTLLPPRVPSPYGAADRPNRFRLSSLK